MNETVFTFDGYTVRPVSERDRVYLDLLITADPYHADRMTPDFFLDLGPGEDAWAMEDEDHRIVFYFKTATVVRVAIQFADWGSHRARNRNQRALTKGLRWIENLLRQNRFTEMIFDSEGPELRQFAGRRMGFVTQLIESKTLARPRGWATLATDFEKEGGMGDVRSEQPAASNHD